MDNEAVYLEIKNSFDFLDAENHNDWLMDNMGDPIPSVTTNTFNIYLSFIIHLLKSCPPKLPINITLCCNQSIDISLYGNDNTPHLLINIKENRIGWYGFTSTSSIPNEKYKKIYNNEIKGESTSEIPDHSLIIWINKYF